MTEVRAEWMHVCVQAGTVSPVENVSTVPSFIREHKM